MTTYIIYEIVGRKVGCTKDLEYRMSLYEEMEGTRPRFVRILERYICDTDQEAGDREQWWRKELGYLPDTHYAVTMNAVRIRGQKGAQRTLEVIPPEQLAEIRRNAGYRSYELGVGVHGLSAERRTEIGRNGGRIGGVKGGRMVGARNAKKAAEKGLLGFQTGAAGKSGGKIGGRRVNELGLSGVKQMGTCSNCGFVCN